MFVGGAEGVVVEVVDDDGALVRREVDVEFEEEGDEAGGCGEGG